MEHSRFVFLTRTDTRGTVGAPRRGPIEAQHPRPKILRQVHWILRLATCAQFERRARWRKTLPDASLCHAVLWGLHDTEEHVSLLPIGAELGARRRSIEMPGLLDAVQLALRLGWSAFAGADQARVAGSIRARGNGLSTALRRGRMHRHQGVILSARARLLFRRVPCRFFHLHLGEICAAAGAQLPAWLPSVDTGDAANLWRRVFVFRLENAQLTALPTEGINCSCHSTWAAGSGGRCTRRRIRSVCRPRLPRGARLR